MGFFDSESIWGETIARFIIQLLLMIIISRLMHLVLDRLLKEPLVISEIITGIILGMFLNVGAMLQQICWFFFWSCVDIGEIQRKARL